MTIHANLTGADLHETKGADSAAANHILIANGGGTATFQRGFPYGGRYFTNFTTPYSIAATTTYQKVAAATTATHLNGFQQITGGLQYIGTENRHVHMVSDFSFDQSSGGNRDITVGWYKNGVLMTGAETVTSTVSGNYQTTAMHWDTMASTNDYFELFVKADINTTVNFEHIYTFIMGMPG